MKLLQSTINHISIIKKAIQTIVKFKFYYERTNFKTIRIPAIRPLANL